MFVQVSLPTFKNRLPYSNEGTGVTDTPLARGGAGKTEEQIANLKKLAGQLASRIPLGRMAYSTDIADAILYFLSDSSSFVTGQVLPVNGGSD